MADEQKAEPKAPPSQGVSQFVINATPVEIMITAGVSRMVPHTNGTMTRAVEWLVTLAISPIAAKQLADGLTDTIQRYEKHFGKIPVDPDFKLLPARSDGPPRQQRELK